MPPITLTVDMAQRQGIQIGATGMQSFSLCRSGAGDPHGAGHAQGLRAAGS